MVKIYLVLLMLNLNQIRSIIAGNQDYMVSPEDLGASKRYILLLDDVEGLEDKLNQIKPYAPYWNLSGNVLVTSKMVYASILMDLLERYGKRPRLVFGQIVDGSALC